jgi:uncharacterized membrane protein YedE/YeeE
MDLSVFLPPLAGGLMIGAASVLLLIGLGRIAGISGIAFGLMDRPNWNTANLWRAGFVIGLLAAGWVWTQWTDQPLQPERTANVPLLIASGLLVGFGTSLGSGCTSGHGVCGLGRLSVRSLAAVLTFMLSAGVTVFVVRHVLA